MQWPAADHPRTRLLRYGSASLADGELLAILLGDGLAVHELVALAQRLLCRPHGLVGVLRARRGELLAVRGMGPARLARLEAALEIGRRYLEAPAAGRLSLQAPLDAVRFFKARLADLPHEAFGCLYLDTRHRVIHFEALFRGTVDGATVYPREVLRRALDHNASALIVGHNHPSGVCEPSEADRAITLKLAKALALLDIRLLDHLVVTRDGHVSLAELGWL
jgi:DNA repair protein RadC